MQWQEETIASETKTAAEKRESDGQRCDATQSNGGSASSDIATQEFICFDSNDTMCAGVGVSVVYAVSMCLIIFNVVQ